MKKNKNEAPITPELLVWAREKAGLTIGEAVVPEFAEKLSEWEEGKSKPTISQAEKLAEIYKVPFAAFFLPKPPKKPKPLTLREIIKEALEAHSEVRDPYEFGDVLGSVLKKLEQLEERIEGIVAKEELNKKELFVSTLGIELSKGAIWACEEILGEK